ncbi:MAG: site-specific DNA-methyltransferase [Clostridium sp.]|nr:site-specific DNA-methyltransferase [Clostridium sp.]
MKETINDELKMKDIDTVEKINGESLDIVKENVKKLKEIFPEVFCEDKIDFKRLEEVLGEYTDDSDERYRFEWHGKSQAIKFSQTPSKGTLRPCKEESKNWDTTENLYIEGDNLEVLKLLQKSYQGKIKVIYIDPPYNTGSDFVYPDNYRDNIENYLKITRQKDEEGNKISTNSETDGSYHTKWLNMMYPRLRLSKNLLHKDGIMFVSIDDNEVENLKKICDEIFGESNFIAYFTWIKKKKGSHLSKTVRNMTEYVLCYAKEINKIELFGEEAYSDKWQPLVKRTNAHKILVFPSNEVETKLIDGEYEAGVYGEGTSSLEFMENFIVHNNKVKTKIKVNGPFVWTQGKLNEEIEKGTKISLSSKFGFNVFRSDQEEKIKRPITILDSKLNIGTNEDAYKEIISIFGKEGIMSYPKPISLIKYLIRTISYYYKDMIVLDFFSGSSTTAHAVMQLNAEDKGNRKFIMVQLPEECDENSEAYKAGYKNICEIGKERIRRAGDKIVEENKDKEGIENLDIGFKVFKLAKSNIKPWNPDYDNLKMTLEDSINNFVPGRKEEDIVYEIMLKYGIDLTYPVDVKEVCGKKIFSIGFGALIVCLDSEITLELVNEIVKYKNELNPKICRVVFRDNGFKTDSVKTNAIEILHRNNIKEIMSI